MKNKDLEFDRKTQFVEAVLKNGKLSMKTSNRPDKFEEYTYIRTEYGATRIKETELEAHNDLLKTKET